jgi:hypothetical protein
MVNRASYTVNSGLSTRQDPLSSLFPKLSPRTPGVDPDDVARHQRNRLIGAMVVAVSRKGYDAVTVGELVAVAGVSKTAFYRQFANKEAVSSPPSKRSSRGARC